MTPNFQESHMSQIPAIRLLQQLGYTYLSSGELFAARCVDACDEELRLLRARRAAVEKQKRGLMQRLLTGRTRTGTRTHGQTRTDKD